MICSVLGFWFRLVTRCQVKNETVLSVDSQVYREEVMGMGLCLMIRLRRSTTAEITIIPRSLKAPKRTDSITSHHPLYPTLLLSSKGYQKETGAAVRRASARICESMSEKQSR